MKEKKILCRNKSERNAVLRKLEEQGVRWVSGNDRPTEWECDEWSDNSEIVLVVGDDNVLWWGCANYYKGKHKKLIPAKEFLVKQKTKPFLIYRRGREVYAEDKNTGLMETAICSPDDTFDLYTGAMIALCRLVGDKLGEDAKAEMRKVLGEEKKPEDDEIRVGSTVRVTRNISKSFTSYINWFVINNIPVELAARYAIGRTPFNGELCVVRAIHPHELSRYGDVYLLQSQDFGHKCYLMAREGFEKL